MNGKRKYEKGNEAVSLVNAGHEVFLFCLKYANEKASETINGIQA